MTSLPPGWIMILGVFVVLVLPKSIRSVGWIVLPVVSLAHLLSLEVGNYANVEMLGMQLTFSRVDRLSRVFGIIFHVVAILGFIYAWHVKDRLENGAAMVYAGSAIGAVFAGDLLTLFVFWELTAISSVFLIWACRTEQSYKAGMRYLIIQVGSGVLLMSGIMIHLASGGSLEFDNFVATDAYEASESPLHQIEATSSGPLSDKASKAPQRLTLAVWLILASFGIKSAFPLLHCWLQDAYPKATVTGTVFLSAFTTKLAVYALARGFAGFEPLIWVGTVMTLFPIFFAVIENDLRKVLAYSLNNQLGFMVVGVGIGSALAINGTVAHAFCHILYKSLLFMSMGAVLYRVGTVKATELGGLYRTMPWTALFCGVGAASISAFPLFSGFVSKSMILSALAEEGRYVHWLLLLVASAGVMEHSGIKIPFFAFFGHDSGKRPKEAPRHMLIAMGVASMLCVLIGVAYPILYAMLPNELAYKPYTTHHVVAQLQLLMMSGLAFVALMKFGLYPPEVRAENLDVDWIYRRFLPRVIGPIEGPWENAGGLSGHIHRWWHLGSNVVTKSTNGMIRLLGAVHRPGGIFGRSWSTSAMATWAAILLATFLLLYYR